MEKVKRLFVFRCDHANPEAFDDPTDGYFVDHVVKGPPSDHHPTCPSEGCRGKGTFVGVYVLEGAVERPAKAGKRKK